MDERITPRIDAVRHRIDRDLEWIDRDPQSNDRVALANSRFEDTLRCDCHQERTARFRTP